MNPPPTNENNAASTSDLISAEMSGAIYLGTFKPAAGGKVPVIDKASGEITINDKVPAYPF